MSEEKIVSELTENIEVIGPGKILAEARKLLGLSQQQVAEKLNFRTVLIDNIESEIFDPALPATFNRGYLRNYAKLVNVSEEDVLSSYAALNVAEKMSTEMKSFSKGTEKQAESNRIMWISYLILAALVGSTIVWWLQESKVIEKSPSIAISKSSVVISSNTSVASETEISMNETEVTDLPENIELISVTGDNIITEAIQANESNSIDEIINTTVDNAEQLTNREAPNAIVEEVVTVNNNELIENVEPEIFAPPVNIVFTFSGDCWVNIYDATGEHIAWGIKKSGYVMNISAVPPLSVTLGKPELVAINFDENDIDTSHFNAGNIAKFTLPLAP